MQTKTQYTVSLTGYKCRTLNLPLDLNFRQIFHNACKDAENKKNRQPQHAIFFWNCTTAACHYGLLFNLSQHSMEMKSIQWEPHNIPLSTLNESGPPAAHAINHAPEIKKKCIHFVSSYVCLQFLPNPVKSVICNNSPPKWNSFKT